MKQALAVGALWIMLLFGGAWLLAPRLAAEAEEPGPSAPQSGGETLADSQSVLQVYDGEKTVEMTMAEYLPGVVRGEMPATFALEALKAQAVAERTFIYYHMQGGRKAAHRTRMCVWITAAAMPGCPGSRQKATGVITLRNMIEKYYNL